MVAATIHPLPGRKTPAKPAAPLPAAEPIPQPAAQPAAKTKAPPKFVKPAKAVAAPPPAPAPAPARPQHPWNGPDHIEPRRKHRIAKERDPIGARIDLHGLDYDQARSALDAFVRRAWS
jgi:DNA-nicking Smr family endonuclease